MDRRFAARRDELLAYAHVHPAILRGLLPRLQRFLDPFVNRLQRREQTQHARHHVAGLLSKLEDKNVESIAYLHDQEREPLQQFISQSPWAHQVWLTALTRQVGEQLGRPEGVLVYAADVARAVKLPLGVDAQRIAGQPFNCYDLYVAEEQVARIAKELTGSASVISNRNRGPKHQIDTSKLRALGLTFGGEALLCQTVQELVEAHRRKAGGRI
jgi:hypothetical protein